MTHRVRVRRSPMIAHGIGMDDYRLLATLKPFRYQFILGPRAASTFLGRSYLHVCTNTPHVQSLGTCRSGSLQGSYKRLGLVLQAIATQWLIFLDVLNHTLADILGCPT